MDHIPVGPPPEPPPPSRASLTLLVGRVSTIKLAYWAFLTMIEAVLPLVSSVPFGERFRVSVVTSALASVAGCAWARIAARAPDRRAGMLERSIPTIATTFVATTVVASPASLPLLIIERERSLEQCGIGMCHPEALLLWVGVVAVGTLAIPAVFAASLHRSVARDPHARSAGL